jgi:hypothetical protein
MGRILGRAEDEAPARLAAHGPRGPAQVWAQRAVPGSVPATCRAAWR